MTLSHFYHANQPESRLDGRIDDADGLYPDVSPQDHARFLALDDGSVYQNSFDLVMSVRLDELRREHGFFIND